MAKGATKGSGLGPIPRGSADKPWEAFTPGDVSQPELRDPERQKVASKIEVDRKNRFQPSELPGQAPLEHVPLAKVARPEPKPLPLPEPAPGDRRGETGRADRGPQGPTSGKPAVNQYPNRCRPGAARYGRGARTGPGAQAVQLTA